MEASAGEYSLWNCFSMKIDIYFIHVEQKFHIVGRSKETCDIDRLINGCIVCSTCCLCRLSRYVLREY